jgi:hypothetical protein
MTNLNTLTDADLDQVCGGMDCAAASAVAKVYIGISIIMEAVGRLGDSAGAAGMALGVLQGACSK